MSKYTTELRFICETLSDKDESVGLNSIDEVIDSALPKIFDFDYPIFDESYKNVLERKIIKHFYTREIGEETYGLWKFRLNTKMNEIMPMYNQLYKSELFDFNPIYTTDLTRTHVLKGESENVTSGQSNSSASGSNDSNTTVNENSKDISKFNDTPQGSIKNIENDTYLTSATINTNENHTENNTVGHSSNSSNTNTSSNQNINSTENYVEKISGFEGHNPNKLLADFRKNIINIDVQILEDLEVLFINLW